MKATMPRLNLHLIALMLTATLGLVAGCTEGASPSVTATTAPPVSAADTIEIAAHFSGESKAIITTAWPKVEKLCPGLSKYRSEFVFSEFQDNSFRDDFDKQDAYKYLQIGINVTETPADKNIVRYGAFGHFCAFDVSPDGHFVEIAKSMCLKLCLDSPVIPKLEGTTFLALDNEGRALGEQLTLAASIPVGNSVGYVLAQDAFRTLSTGAIAQRRAQAAQQLASAEVTTAMRSCHSTLVALGAGKFSNWTRAVGRECGRLPKSQQTQVLEIASKSLSPDVSMASDIETIVESVQPDSSPAFFPALANAVSEWGAMGGNLVMRSNHIYALQAHGDKVGACAWGLISQLENHAELANTPNEEERLLRACKQLRAAREPEVTAAMSQLLTRAKNL